jgi:hypothetical protein
LARKKIRVFWSGIKNIGIGNVFFFFQNDAVPSPDVPLNIMYHQLKDAGTSEERDRIRAMISDEHKVNEGAHVVLLYIRNCIVVDINMKINIDLI